MILSCPSCATRFRVGDDSLGVEGRRVRCSVCGREWRMPGATPPAVPRPIQSGSAGRPVGEAALPKPPAPRPAQPGAGAGTMLAERLAPAPRARFRLWPLAALLLLVAVAAAWMLRGEAGGDWSLIEAWLARLAAPLRSLVQSGAAGGGA